MKNSVRCIAMIVCLTSGSVAACTDGSASRSVAGRPSVQTSASASARPSPEATASVAAPPSTPVPHPTGPRSVIATASRSEEPWRLFVYPTETGTALGLSLAGDTITGCCVRPLWSPIRAAVYWESEGMLIAFASVDVTRLEYRPIAVSGVLDGELHTVSDPSLHIPRVAIFDGLAPNGPDGFLVGIDPTGSQVWRKPVGLPPHCRMDHRRCLGFLDDYRMSARS
jgi:hypothetical protein